MRNQHLVSAPKNIVNLFLQVFAAMITKIKFHATRACAVRTLSSSLPMLLLACCFGTSLSASNLAGAATVATDPVLDAARSLIKRGALTEAVDQGMAALLLQPWNHALRLLVADTLQHLGRLDAAAVQFDTLEGTAYANKAAELRRSRSFGAIATDLKLTTVMSTASLRDPPEKMPRRQRWMILDDAVSAADASIDPAQYDRPMSGRADLADGNAQAEKNEPLDSIESARSAAARRLTELNAADNYSAVVQEGVPLLATEKLDDELRLIIANSLSWTNHLAEAVPVYESLMTGTYANQARIGLGNIRHWSGRDDQAVGLFKQVLAEDPANADALAGIAQTRRALAPRTTTTLGGFKDSTGVQRRSLAIEHRWRDASASNIYAVEVGGVDDRLDSATLPSQAKQQAVTLRYQGLNLALRPSVELSLPSHSGSSLFATVVAHIGNNDQNQIELGRVNWGNAALNPNALAAHLTASHIGAQAISILPLGTVVGRVDGFDISDGNQIVSSSVRLASSWRPLGSDIKPFVGIETRSARFNSSNYWSPATGYGSIFAGLEREWENADWTFSLSGQLGKRLYGEAGISTAFFGSGKRWLSADVAVGVNFSTLSSLRDGAAYRASSINLTLEKLW